MTRMTKTQTAAAPTKTAAQRFQDNFGPAHYPYYAKDRWALARAGVQIMGGVFTEIEVGG